MKLTRDSFSIGLAYVEAYAEKGYKVIAAVRDTSKMPTTKAKDVIVIKLDSASLSDAKEVTIYFPRYHMS